jgi:hypothetical protein
VHVEPGSDKLRHKAAEFLLSNMFAESLAQDEPRERMCLAGSGEWKISSAGAAPARQLEEGTEKWPVSSCLAANINLSLASFAPDVAMHWVDHDA